MEEEKYECVILKFVINILSNGSGNVNTVCFRGFVLDSLYLYLWYSQIISISNFEWVVLCFLLVEHCGGIDSITIVVVLVVW